MAKILSIEKPVDGNFKVVKDSDGTSTALELSADKVKAKNLEVAGETTGLLLPIDEPIQFQNDGQVSTIKSYNTNDFEIRAARDLDIVSGREIVLDTATESGDAIIIKAATDITLDATGTDVLIKNDDSLGFQFRTIVGTGSYLNIFERGGTTEDDVCQIKVMEHGATTISTIDDAASAAHLTFNVDGHIDMGKATGFTKIAETFSDDSIIGSGGTDDTHIDFRASNKISLAVTGDITNLNLIFPAITGNFVLLLTYDGDHDITNWKVYESDESSADGDADVLWAGGTAPATTDSGIDIISFFYDATAGADKCYGTASLDFSN